MPDRASRFSLHGKRALVTGASRGIGREIATVLADVGGERHRTAPGGVGEQDHQRPCPSRRMARVPFVSG